MGKAYNSNRLISPPPKGRGSLAGQLKLTQDITRFIALEGRSWVISVSGLLRPTDFVHLAKDDLRVG